MSRTVSTTGTFSANLSSYISNSVDGAWYSISNPDRAYTALSSSTYATINLTRGANGETWCYFTFNTSTIPQNAVIDSVSCSVKVYISNSSSSALPVYNYQLFSGTNAKGSPNSNFINQTKTVTLDAGTWTRAEVEDVRLRFYAIRGTNNTVNTGIGTRLYGAELTIGYTVNETYYELTTGCNSSSVVISPASGEYLAGSDVSISISGDITGGTVTDNNVDVTSSLSGSGTTHTYTISNIAADHVVYVSVLQTGQEIFVKQNGSWVEVDKVYVKQNGVWKEVETLLIKQNGSWVN